MPCILHIDTSTEVCSIAISENGRVILDLTETTGPSHASILGVFADEAIKFIRKNNKSLDAVAVSCGPGSYTGLRIGVSEAKGICFGLNIPLIAINSLLLMAAGVIHNNRIEGNNTLFCPMIDARRMEVYAAIYDQELNVIRDIQADIVDTDTYRGYLDKGKIVFFGNGALKCKDTINHPNAIFLENISPLASQMIELAEKAFAREDFVDVAYFEPFYLKEFVATTPKNKVLG
ncbi:tRNA threonylcarbamoyladenosine biosynthesis protein TsaB [Dysgonomonas sp. PH5-45]|uniref:tRNA (adenosine(37)-N6)-threonylcarbamoyltransferase complex dimerization subunit type 1 TsaB n=1 Tax=unclassified Dysgonomonas TaxID=2630389 RepID=UPI002476F944|nr:MULTISPECIES: tRNA (adenosine(37)-N6)-threonylcarbamoyltransferase complex dimerization subunit type 1 TsaB [unclassified Dysgonomonas]MDH6355788.1 tRNA threonylcarbamoyladenosine biosynthesis protein TsaB [Dysgonomonas sp. PH5-45]MDH6388685.1 tRNA threonylcarbamoyladenosine biosynthesis protein TsaB [Dysgonomonas sp. PH5-37]